jgi:hypothetical protein
VASAVLSMHFALAFLFVKGYTRTPFFPLGLLYDCVSIYGNIYIRNALPRFGRIAGDLSSARADGGRHEP